MPSALRRNDMTPIAAADPRELNSRVAGAVFTPADDGWDAARMAWNVAVDQRPAAVAHPVDEEDVAAVIAYARENGLRVAPQGTGHNARPLGSLDQTILLRTSAMRGVEIHTPTAASPACAREICGRTSWGRPPSTA